MQKSKLQFKLKNFRHLIIYILCLIFPFSAALAAELFFNAAEPRLELGQSFEVVLFLKTVGRDINALEGKVTFPKDLLELKKISDGNSAINFWIERPREKDGEIIFSGVIPGGLAAEQGLILSMVFQSKKEGSGVIKIDGTKALLNDGQGRAAPLSIVNWPFIISKHAPVSEGPISKIDTEPPEPFTPSLARDANIFEGQWFLVFAAQDKGSGIERYEVQEKPAFGKRPWLAAESPYLLQDQSLRSIIKVRAIDQAGNVRLAELAAVNQPVSRRNYMIFGLAALIIVVSLLWRKIKSRKE